MIQFADGWSPIASHYKKITLAPGETKTLVFILGYVEMPVDQKFEADGKTINKVKALEMIEKYNTPEKVAAGLKELKEHWNRLLGILNVNTPDDKVNRMVNIWNQYQCMVTFNLSRSASYFESGIGRGMGFRDSNQDVLGFVHQIPDRARERIIDIASTQFPDGGCYHQYQPLTKKGNADIGGDFSDDPLWLILSVSAYIKETGDWGILDEMVPYDNDMSIAKPMLDHLKVSFYKIVNNLGPHGLPLAMRADWNDCINLSCFSDTPGESFQTYTNPKFAAEGGYSKVAESVMVATLFTYTGPNYVAILKHLGMDAEADAAQAEIDKMKANIMESAWDGDWFLRAYDAMVRRWDLRSARKARSSSSHRDLLSCLTSARIRAATRRLLLRSTRDSIHSTDLYSTTQHSQSITSSMVRFLHTQADTRRMPEYSHITMHGSSVPLLTQVLAIRHLSTTQR